MSIKPGIYEISNEEYHGGQGISRSGIMEFRKSPLHYWNRYLREDRVPTEQTSALVLGNAFHTFVLEPEQFFQCYAIEIKVDKRTKKGKKAWAEFEAELRGREIISQSDFDQIVAMANSVNSNPYANNLIVNSMYEKSIFWVDKETGLLCKCRPDILRPDMVADLKTTADASERSFQRDIYEYGYHIQAAMIQDGILATKNTLIQDFVFIPVEKKTPYANTVYILDPEAIEKGRDEYKSTLLKMKTCFERDEWPGYERKFISLPNYAFYL